MSLYCNPLHNSLNLSSDSIIMNCKPKLYLTLVLLVFGALQVSAQGYNGYMEHWHFGKYASIEFNGGNPSAKVGSELNTPEGVATISHSASQHLRFYSDGNTIWNINHDEVIDGTGIKGDPNSSQAAILLPDHQNAKYVHLYTTDAEGGPDGLMATEVDENVVYGGKVTYKNLQLCTPVTEQLTSALHCTYNDYWIISHKWESDSFIAVRQTELHSDSIVYSKTGAYQGGNVDNAIGCMKSNMYSNMIARTITGMDLIEIFYFDNLYGTLTHAVTIHGYESPYGIEFSPDGFLLYVALLTGEIYQFNITTLNETAIKSTEYLVATTNTLTGSLQLGPDERIYISRDLDPYLGVIRFPEIWGNGCSYIKNGVFLGGNIAEAGLPQAIIPGKTNKVVSNNSCYGDSAAFEAHAVPSMDSVFWDFGDTLSGDANYSTLIAPKHLYTLPGQYTVKLTIYYCDTIEELEDYVCVDSVPQAWFDDTITFCEFVGDTLYPHLRIHNCFINKWLWSTGDTTPTITVISPGDYWVKIENQCGSDQDTVYMKMLPAPVVDLGPDQKICPGENVILDAGCCYDSIVWWDGVSGIQCRVVDSSGFYSIKVGNQYDCWANDHIFVEVIQPPNIDGIYPDTTICIGIPMELGAPYGFDSYLWQDGSTGKNIYVADSGWYSLYVANMCGEDTDSFYVKLEDCSMKLYVPNAFTPDGDGLNDVFYAVGQYVDEFNMKVFNKWGHLVFESKDLYDGWDGTYAGGKAMTDWYVWVIKYTDATGKRHLLKGQVKLIR